MKYQGDSLAKFSEQIFFALENYFPHGLNIANFDNIILSGLGGSGIAARISKSYFAEVSTVPMEVISDYHLPKYAGKRTLAIMSSYSGNTEETLSMFHEAKASGATIICISTGGTLGELATSNQLLFYKAETGFQPRMALGYSLTYLMLIFGELFGQDKVSELKSAASELSNPERYIVEAKDIVNKHINLNLKTTIIADAFSAPVALRFCQQIQENAKAEAFYCELPEANHNVIESYYGVQDSNIIFLNSHSNGRTDLRFKFVKEVMKESNNSFIDWELNKEDLTDYLQKIYIMDWISLLMADARGKVSSDIKNIIALKDYLSENK